MRSTTAVDAQHLYISKRVGYQSKKIIASLSAFKKSAQFINSFKRTANFGVSWTSAASRRFLGIPFS